MIWSEIKWDTWDDSENNNYLEHTISPQYLKISYENILIKYIEFEKFHNHNYKSINKSLKYIYMVAFLVWFVIIYIILVYSWFCSGIDEIKIVDYSIILFN